MQLLVGIPKTGIFNPELIILLKTFISINFFVSFPTILRAQNIEITVPFDRSEFLISRIDSFDKINNKSNKTVYYFQPEGFPELPYLSYYILLPNFAHIESIQLKESSLNRIEGYYNIILGTSDQEESRTGLQNDSSILNKHLRYTSAATFPPAGQAAKFDSAELFAGFMINRIYICPFNFNPKTHELNLYNRVTLDVYYKVENTSVVMEKSPEKIELSRNVVRERVVNYKDVDSMIPLEQKIDYSKVKIYEEENINQNKNEDVGNINSPTKEEKPFYIHYIKSE
jgi:hypothetical protein